MEHLYEKALESAEYIKTHTKKLPKIAVVLGSGLGKLTADFTDTEELSYKDIPNFPVSTVAGHKGALLAGKLGDTEVYAMEGRFHFYEGYSMKEVCYPFYVFKLLGVEKVVLTNACGGINREFAPGTLMLITDFINMMGTNPLIGPNDERFGPRFPDMTESYSLELRNLAKQTADELGIAYKEGVYMGFMGPCYETAAEIRDDDGEVRIAAAERAELGSCHVGEGVRQRRDRQRDEHLVRVQARVVVAERLDLER